MRIIHLSDIHVWRYSWDVRHWMSARALGFLELLSGRARRFHLNRLAAVVDRVLGLRPDHVLITGDLTTTALPSEFRMAKRLLEPLLAQPDRITIVPGNHDRTTRRSLRIKRFEKSFGAYMGAAEFPWIRWIDQDTAILGLDPTRAHFSARGRLPDHQLKAARELAEEWRFRGGRLLVACHYPVVAPAAFQRELRRKRMENDEAVIAWLAGLGPHLYCCGHVHAAWAFRPPCLPNHLCLNAGAPLMGDSTGLRLPGFLEIILYGNAVSVVHHAWAGSHWKAVPILPSTRLSELSPTRDGSVSPVVVDIPAR
jgi:hypothetical protein